MSTTQFIDELVAGNASGAKDMLNDMLSARAFEALEGRKIEIAQNIFNGSVQEEEVEITQEEFDALSEKEQEMYLEQLEQLDEVSQKTAIKAFVTRAGREGDDDSKSTKTMDRIFKKHGQKGVVKAANALDKDQRPFSSDYTKKDYVSGVLAKHGADQNYDSRNKPDSKPSKGPVKGRGYA
jgi:hypothetical protein